MPSSTAARMKIRCPKCTARILEPAEPIFNCPICSARLSGKEIINESVNGHLRSAKGLASANASYPAQGKLAQAGTLQLSAANGDDGDQDDSCQELLPSLIHSDIEQEPSSCVRKLSSLALESDHMSLSCTFERSFDSTNTKLEDVVKTLTLPSFTRGGNEQTHEDIRTRYQPLLDCGEKVSMKGAEMEDSNVADENEVIEEQDGEEKEDVVEARDWTLQSQILCNTRYDFSFKYALENASSLEAGDRSLHGKRSPRSRIPMDEQETRENSLPPLKVRISNSPEESSDQSDFDQFSFKSETASHGRESELDIPAPLLESRQEVASCAQDDPLHSDANQIVSSMPHQLELLDSEEWLDQGGLPNPSKPLHGSVCEAFAKSEDAGIVSEVEKGPQVKQEKRANSQDVGFSGKSFFSNRVQDEASEVKHVLEGSFSEDCHMQQSPSSLRAKAFAVGRAQGSERGESTHFHQPKARKWESNESETRVVSLSDGKQPSKLIKGQLGQNKRGDTRPTMNQVDNLLSNASKLEYLNRDSIIPHATFPSQHMDMEHNVHMRPVVEPCHGEHEGHPQINKAGLSVASLQPYIASNFAAEHSGLRLADPTHFYAYDLQPHPLVLPGALQSHAYHALSYPACHHISPVCTICVHHQHPHVLPQQIPLPPFAFCLNQSGSSSYCCGHAQNHEPGSTYASSSHKFSQPLSASTRLAHSNDEHTREPRLKATLARKANHYPPLPEDRAAPYITCRGCSRILRVPPDLPYSDGSVQKIRCVACTKICKFSTHSGNELRSLARATNMCQ